MTSKKILLDPTVTETICANLTSQEIRIFRNALGLSSLDCRAPKEIILDPIYLEKICNNLTFEEGIQLRAALNVKTLNCSIPISDRDRQISALGPINQQTIQVYQLIKQQGSIESLISAANNNQVDLMKILVQQGAQVYESDRWENTALISASGGGSLEAVKFLLAAGADPNQDNWDERTPLHEAALYGHREIVKLLLENGANPRAESNSIGETPLDSARDMFLQDPDIRDQIIQLLEAAMTT